MLTKIKNRIVDKWRRFWKWIAFITVGTAMVLAATNGLPSNEIPFVEVNGEVIEFSYTDDNTGENLIIRTDKQTYGGFDGTNVFMMIENISGEKQETKIKLLFSDESKFLAEISRLEKDVPYQVQVDDYGIVEYDCSTSTNGTIEKTCTSTEVIGSHQETRYKDEWQPLEDIDNEAEFALPKNKIAYFKTHIQFPPRTKDEFFIEITGDKQGWGRLDPWYDSNWDYKRKLTIASSTIDDVLTDFPATVFFTSSTFDFSHAKEDGTDIIFVNSAEDTLLGFEREDPYSSSSEIGVFHVKIPTVASSTDTDFYVYYGNDAASDTSSSTAPWDSSFKGVWHMNQDPTPDGAQMLDSTVNGHDGTSAGTMDSNDLVDAKIGKGLHFDGSDDYIVVPDSDDWYPAAGDWTIDFWVNFDTCVNGNRYLLVTQDHQAADDYFTVRREADDKLEMLFYKDGVAGRFKSQAVWRPTTGIWYHLSFARNGSGGDIYANGATLTATETTAWGTITNLPANLTFAGWGRGSYEVDGLMDEIRYSKGIARSLAWVKATYNSGNDSLLTYGSEVIGNRKPVISSVSDNSPKAIGSDITFSVAWTDADNEGVNIFICKTNAITASTTSICDGGDWCSSTASFSTTTPLTCNYTVATSTDQDYWAFACDDEPTCSVTTATSTGRFFIDLGASRIKIKGGSVSP